MRVRESSDVRSVATALKLVTPWSILTFSSGPMKQHQGGWEGDCSSSCLVWLDTPSLCLEVKDLKLEAQLRKIRGHSADINSLFVNSIVVVV